MCVFVCLCCVVCLCVVCVSVCLLYDDGVSSQQAVRLLSGFENSGDLRMICREGEIRVGNSFLTCFCTSSILVELSAARFRSLISVVIDSIFFNALSSSRVDAVSGSAYFKSSARSILYRGNL